MSENILRTNCEICESCKTKLSTVDLSQEPDLILCELCKPWVLHSIYQVPKSVIGIAIKDPEMFRHGLKLMEGFTEPEHERDWLTLLCHIFSKKIYDEETYVSTLGTDMVNSLRQDYGNRWKIYDDEALEMFDMSKKVDCIEPEALYALFEGLEFEHWANDLTYHFDFMLDMEGILIKYLKKRNENQEHQDSLKASGWGDYVKLLTFNDEEPKIYKINHRFEVTTEQIHKVLDWAEKHDINYDFVLQLFFDYATSHAHSTIDGLLYETNIYAPKIRLASFKHMPTSPEFCRQIYCLAKGYHGQNLQYLILAAIHRWGQQLSPSHHFLVRDEQVWSRSFQLLRGIIESLGSKRARIDVGLIKIKGESGRWYGIETATYKTDLQHWQVTSLPKGNYICIDIQEQHLKMPIGDQLASVVLTLANDILMEQEVHTLRPENFGRILRQ